MKMVWVVLESGKGLNGHHLEGVERPSNRCKHYSINLKSHYESKCQIVGK